MHASGFRDVRGSSDTSRQLSRAEFEWLFMMPGSQIRARLETWGRGEQIPGWIILRQLKQLTNTPGAYHGHRPGSI